MEDSKTYQELLAELKAVRADLAEKTLRLEEATDTIEAIRSGEIDALVVKDNDGHQLYTLKSADQTYRIFIEQMNEGAVTLNQNGQILYCNSQFASLIGLPLEKVTGRNFQNFIPDNCRAECGSLITAAWTKNIKGELMLLTISSTETPVLLSFKTLDLDEGLSMSIIVTDLSEQKKTQRLLQQQNMQLEKAQLTTQHLNANLERTVRERTKTLETAIIQKGIVETELRSNQEQLTRILETMAEGVGIINAEGRLIYANPMAQKILGLRKDEILERTYHDPKWQNLRLDGSPLPEDEHPMTITMTTGQPVYDYEIGIHPPGGERFYISINAAPIRDDKGQIVAGVGTFMDVTHRRKSIQQKDEFISVASHELRTPITSLKASLQLLNRMKDNPSPAMLPKLIEQSNKSLNKVSVLINDLLNATKINEGQLDLNKKQFVLAELVNDCCNEVRNENTIPITVKGDLTLEVYADADKIDQVIINFVNNAVKYAATTQEIIICIEKSTGAAKVSVMDKGQGISPEKLPYLFERYYRVDTSGIQYSGLGLGLYISAEIIRKHNGVIGAESIPGQGSTFWFTLPL